MSESRTDSQPPETIDYIAVDDSPRFQELKHKHRSFVWPLTVFFIVWYFAFVLLSSFAPEFMSQPVFGVINVGLLLGLGQFATTFIITMWYVWYANHRLDPISSEIRDELEKLEPTA